MLNKMVKIIKGLVIGFKYCLSSIKDQDINMVYGYELIQLEKQGYIIKHNTKRSIQNGGNICSITLFRQGNNYIPVIIKDGLFDMLSKESQEFIIQHELGHFNLHLHLLTNEKLIGTIIRNENVEFEADAYAVCKVGKEQAIRAIEEILQIVNTMNFGKETNGMKEFKLRIEKINNL